VPSSIPVICDRCRAEGFGHSEEFADFGDLLDFEPVPRRPRADGWSPEVQRAFIAALALTGSDRQAARAVGKAQYGVEQLKNAKANEGFMAAHARAIAMAADDKSRRLAAGVHAVTAPSANWRPPDPAWANAATRGHRPLARAALPAEDKMTDEQKLAWIEKLVCKYLLKVRHERKARLAGRVVEADFYVRQLTYIEVSLDLIGTDGFEVFRNFRAGNHHILEIAETPFSRILGEARRAAWTEQGEPPRPEHPPRRYLTDNGRFSTEPLETISGGPPEHRESQQATFEERHRRDAQAQLAWEAAASSAVAEQGPSQPVPANAGNEKHLAEHGESPAQDHPEDPQ
jgi:hypothetical protein